jgi:hypothetical protein
MSCEQPWERLLESLNTWAEAREVRGGIEVTFSASSGARRTVEIVMTSNDWEEVAVVIGRETARSVREKVLALEESQPFLVCDSGVELLPSSTRELLLDPLDESNPGPGGQWVVTDDTGNIVSRFADGNDEER